MRTLLLAALALSACGSPDPDDVTPDPAADAAEVAGAATREAERDTDGLDLGDVSMTGDVPGTPVESVTTRDGQMELGVTDQVVFARLSESLRAEIETEMADETEGQGGLGGSIARAVTGAVAQGLAAAVTVPLGDVRDVRYQGGRVVIEMADGDPSPFDRAKTDDRPMLDQFDAEAGRRLAEAFDKAAGR